MAESVCAHCGGGECACVGVGVGVVLERLIDNVIMIIHNKDQTSYHIIHITNWMFLITMKWKKMDWWKDDITNKRGIYQDFVKSWIHKESCSCKPDIFRDYLFKFRMSFYNELPNDNYKTCGIV